MFKFIYDRLKWPTNFCGEGLVVIRFTVEKDGRLTNHKILRDIGGGCGQEALRVVKLMPNWVPATQRGKVVRSLYNVPIKFKVKE